MAGPAGLGRKARRAAPDPGSGLTTLRFAIEYDGTAFSGFQWQPAARTVAGCLEDALEKLLGEPVAIAGAGRTDAGVHATGQVVSLTTHRTFPFDRLAIALNSALPPDLAVRDVAIVPDGFSARFSARRRTYVYAIFARREPSPLYSRFTYHVWRPLDVGLMQHAARALVGTHDFRSFCGVPPENGNTVRTVESLDLERRGDLVRVEISADGFLHRMVRTIVGTLVDCGLGRRDPETLGAVLAAVDRRAAGHTAPPEGLVFAGVRYDDGYDSYAEPPAFRWHAGQ